MAALDAGLKALNDLREWSGYFVLLCPCEQRQVSSELLGFIFEKRGGLR